MRHLYLLLAAILLIGVLAPAQIPHTLAYQGVLTDSTGNPKADAAYTLTFRLYQAAGGGSAVWTEVKVLQVKRGLFSTLLGDSTPFGNAVTFDRPYWLSLQVDAEPELSPRIPLTSVAYSIASVKSDTAAFAAFAASAPSQAFVDSARIAGRVPDNSVTSAQIVNGTIQSADVDAAFRAPHADTASVALSAPPVVYVDSARIAAHVAPGSVPAAAIPAGQVVKSLNGLTDGVVLIGGNGTTVTPSDDSLIISSGIHLNLPYDAADSSHSTALTITNLLDGDGMDVLSLQGTGLSATGYTGVVAESDLPGGAGVWATANNSGSFAVRGTSNPDSGYAGYFEGKVSVDNSVQVGADMNVTGNLTKGGGSFKIDHPLDPANKYLYHSFVESPDMKNIYDGVALLDGSGEAAVTLPAWFDALNSDFRYQLTAIGAPAPNLYVSQEVSGNRFSIAGGKAGMKVSWQVTGIRKDAYAQKHRIPVEELKAPQERGRYLHPDAFGYPKEMGLSYHAQTARPAKKK